MILAQALKTCNFYRTSFGKASCILRHKGSQSKYKNNIKHYQDLSPSFKDMHFLQNFFWKGFLYFTTKRISEYIQK